jgi:NAD(P)-dependent dehydrogenase (short-subunit alcohol dehydrogenase family)
MTHSTVRPMVEARAQQLYQGFDTAAERLTHPDPSGSFELRDKVAVVTGAGSGIGRALALDFARAGTHVALLDIEGDQARKVADEVRALGVRALAVETDVAGLSSMQAAADAVYQEFGAVHILCNNAGVYMSGLTQDRSYDDWDWVLSVNLYGVINGLLAFVPRMLAETDAPYIVNTASIVGVMFGPSAGIYATTKHAVVGLTEAIAQELEEVGGHASVLCPGGVRTRIMQSGRNRPANLAETLHDPVTDKLAADAIDSGLDPAEVSRAVIRAIRHCDPYIFPQPAAKPFAEGRFKEIFAAFDVAEKRGL